MRLSQLLRVNATALLLTTAIVGLNPIQPVGAISFGEKVVEEENFAIAAAPYRHGYTLMVIEQIPGKRQCWSEHGTEPVIIDPLLQKFDFTNICKRSTDSNNYSIRLDDRDLGMDYLVNIVERDGELHLIGTHRDPEEPELFIGKTNGMDRGSLKFTLNPGWKLSKRTYEGETTDHLYLSGDTAAMNQAQKGCPTVLGSNN